MTREELVEILKEVTSGYCSYREPFLLIDGGVDIEALQDKINERIVERCGPPF